MLCEYFDEIKTKIIKKNLANSNKKSPKTFDKIGMIKTIND